ncbi:MAG: hypothetical protein HGA79_01635 [Anaerolineales bacterium]|jgi:hypothetical protein|nr:hypothetical protein [Candidatus Moduliflexus flocculans]NTU54930.1 hypothetical protein [Anaerolineales bacterium]
MNRRLRIILGVLILALSIALLVWGFMPLDRITRTQPILPSDLQLPTPTSLQIPPILVS